MRMSWSLLHPHVRSQRGRDHAQFFNTLRGT